MNYGKIIEKALTVVWQNKYLWVLGLFADITFGLSIIEDRRDVSGSFDWEDLAANPASMDWLVGISLFVIFLVFIVIIALMIIERIAEGGLISSAGRIDRGQEHSFTDAWKAGFYKFPPMFGLLICQIVLGISLLMAFVLLCLVAKLIATALFILALIFSIPTFFILIFYLSIVFSYAERFVMLEDRGLIDAIGSGLSLLQDELGKSTLMGIIAVLILIVLSLAVILIFLVLAIPLVALYLINNVAGIIFGVLVLLPIGVAVVAYFNSYRSCVWTFFFDALRLGGSGVPAAAAPPPPPDEPTTPPPRFE